ncbi:MAG TPA: DUF3310 domain-containing protein [Xanthobacteraceae bacterium]|jgi:hypothetical protein|nr:DUF3310 domain-containing protein [Xanthobacteraceae bacterium]
MEACEQIPKRTEIYDHTRCPICRAPAKFRNICGPEAIFACNSSFDEKGNFLQKCKVADPVEHPSHYTQGGIECIDALEAALSREEFIGFLRGNVIKYQWRLRHKGKDAEDCRKAIWYAERLAKVLEAKS